MGLFERRPLSPEEQHIKDLEKLKKDIRRGKKWLLVLEDGGLDESEWRHLLPREHQGKEARAVSIQGIVANKETEETKREGEPHVLVKGASIKVVIDTGEDLTDLTLEPKPKDKVRVDFSKVSTEYSLKMEGRNWVQKQFMRAKKGDLIEVSVHRSSLAGTDDVGTEHLPNLSQFAGETWIPLKGKVTEVFKNGKKIKIDMSGVMAYITPSEEGTVIYARNANNVRFGRVEKGKIIWT